MGICCMRVHDYSSLFFSVPFYSFKGCVFSLRGRRSPPESSNFLCLSLPLSVPFPCVFACLVNYGWFWDWREESCCGITAVESFCIVLYLLQFFFEWSLFYAGVQSVRLVSQFRHSAHWLYSFQHEHILLGVFSSMFQFFVACSLSSLSLSEQDLVTTTQWGGHFSFPVRIWFSDNTVRRSLHVPCESVI